MDRTWGAVGSGRLAQELRNLPAGNYELKVAAQNIQEDTPSTAQTGAWIFAETSQLATLNSSLQQTTVTVRDNYTVAFNYVAGSVTIGFEAKDASGNWIAVDNFRLIRVGDNLTAELNEAVEKADAAYGNATGKEAQQLLDAIAGAKAVGATGNWISVDNFRLEYISDDITDVKSELTTLLAQAEALVEKRMNSAAQQALAEAIAAAKQQLTLTDTSGWPAAATALEAAIATATTSHEVFARLADAIAAANNELNSSEATQKDDYQAAINAAQTVYDAATTTDKQAEDAITALAKASFEFKIQNPTGSGTPPTVTTDTRFIRGCTWAFGRSTVKGGNILEEGFCWSEQPDPKVTDHRTTEYLNQAGKIYWLHDLKPATVYYMRAYAINKDYAVGYGDVIKFVTVPKSTVGHWYNNGGDEASNDRINYAIDLSMDYYWNNLTSIHGFGISVTFGPGTPTADCSYGGSMRVGPSSSYQQPGTIMHEALHGIGVGTHGMWWNGEMRSAGNRGDWLGDRVTEAVRFWDNSTTAVITGDDMHLWPYGCNGAQEDTHSDNLYCMMGILAQALNEDGLPGSGEIGYALPYYSFNHNDGVKYYIKNEDESRGLRSAYLVETTTHQLQWKTMTAEDAAADDAAAWYLTFTPNNQYYQLRNAATGYYMTYSSGISTQKTQSPQSAQNFHLMRGRVDVDGHRGYYIIHPESSANPPCLYATTNGKTGTAAWNIAKSAKTQRWLILTAEEAQNFDNGNIDQARAGLADMLARIRKLAKTPHTEDVANADDIYRAYSKGTAKVTTSLYINSTATAVKHICDDRQPNALFNDGGWGSDKQMSDGTYIPNCMTGAEKYFAKGLYDSSVSALLDKAGSSLRIGIKCSSAPTYYWSMFDHFRLHFFGGNDGSEAVGIHAIGNGTTDNAVYSLSGQRQQGMQRGLNIVIENGVVRKVLRK